MDKTEGANYKHLDRHKCPDVSVEKKYIHISPRVVVIMVCVLIMGQTLTVSAMMGGEVWLVPTFVMILRLMNQSLLRYVKGRLVRGTWEERLHNWISFA